MYRGHLAVNPTTVFLRNDSRSSQYRNVRTIRCFQYFPYKQENERLVIVGPWCNGTNDVENEFCDRGSIPNEKYPSNWYPQQDFRGLWNFFWKNPITSAIKNFLWCISYQWWLSSIPSIARDHIMLTLGKSTLPLTILRAIPLDLMF